MWWANKVGTIPFAIRVIFAVVIFAGLYLLAGPIVFNQLGFFLVLLFFLFFDRIVARTEKTITWVDDPVAVISRQQGNLIVCDIPYPVDKLRRLALGDNGKQGYLQFPFNPDFAIRLSFPIQHTEALRTHLQHLLPDIIIVD